MIDWEDMILRRQEALEIWEDQEPLEDVFADFLRDVFSDDDLAEIEEEWEE